MHKISIKVNKFFYFYPLSINGFRLAAPHACRRPCFLRAYASWSYHSMTGLPLFDPSNGCKVALFGDLLNLRVKYPSCWSIFRLLNDMAEPAAPFSYLCKINPNLRNSEFKKKAKTKKKKKVSMLAD